MAARTGALLALALLALFAATAAADAGACDKAACHSWSSFCSEWDDQEAQCYWQCGAFCQRENLCHDAGAQDRAAKADDLDSGCPTAATFANTATAPVAEAEARSPCAAVAKDLPARCRCTDKASGLGLLVDCAAQVDEPMLRLNDTIGMAFDIEPCASPSSVSVRITEATHGVDFPITGITAGTDATFAIPGLSVAVPKVRSASGARVGHTRGARGGTRGTRGARGAA